MLQRRRDLEVVVDGLERVVVPLQPDVADAHGRDEVQDAIDHAQARPEDGDQGEVLASHHIAGRRLQGGLDGDLFGLEIAGHLVGQQHRDLIHQLLEDLLGGVRGAEERDLVAQEGMARDREVRKPFVVGECRAAGAGAHHASTMMVVGSPSSTSPMTEAA